jgi:rod shape-determining protein MreD
MRWLTFILGTVVVLTLQSTIAPRVALFGARPDWLLVIVVFFAMHARAPNAVVGAWIIGACADMMTIERAGLIALSYTLVAMLVCSTREYIFRRRAETQFIVTFVACLLVRLAWTMYCRLLYDPADGLLATLATDVLMGSIYTAAWAPPVHKGLLRVSRMLGLPRPRYTYAG